MLRRLRYWIESARRSEELREEMELHLAEKAAELQADGMTANLLLMVLPAPRTTLRREGSPICT